MATIMYNRATLTNFFFLRLCVSINYDWLNWIIAQINLLREGICLVELSRWVLLMMDVWVLLHLNHALIWCWTPNTWIFISNHYRVRKIIWDNMIILMLKRVMIVAVTKMTSSVSTVSSIDLEVQWFLIKIREYFDTFLTWDFLRVSSSEFKYLAKLFREVLLCLIIVYNRIWLIFLQLGL